MILLGKLIVATILLIAVDINYLQAQTVNRTATWSDNSNNETNFILQRCPGICTPTSTTWSTISTLPADTTSAPIGNVTVPSTTSYRVGALGTGGTGWSAVVVDVLPAPPVSPIIPDNFRLPPCSSLTEILPPTTPKRFLCNP